MGASRFAFIINHIVSDLIVTLLNMIKTDQILKETFLIIKWFDD